MPLAALGPILAGAAGTSAAATSAAWGAIGAGAMAGTSLYDMHKQGDAADNALEFQKQQAEVDRQRFEATQQANYGQYVNRVKGAQALGAKYGFTSIPDPAPYVSTTQPQAAPSPFGPRAIGNYLPRVR